MVGAALTGKADSNGPGALITDSRDSWGADAVDILAMSADCSSKSPEILVGAALTGKADSDGPGALKSHIGDLWGADVFNILAMSEDEDGFDERS